MPSGYLYLKSKSMLGTTSKQYRKRWFVLHEYILSWYKSNTEVCLSNFNYHAFLGLMTTMKYMRKEEKSRISIPYINSPHILSVIVFI
jgi:hypothetical protein